MVCFTASCLQSLLVALVVGVAPSVCGVFHCQLSTVAACGSSCWCCTKCLWCVSLPAVYSRCLPHSTAWKQTEFGLLTSQWGQSASALRCHYTKSNPIDDHSNISSKKLQKQNFKPLGHYTCMQCGTSHLQKVQENILSHIILATYRKFTVATVRFTQNVSCNIFTHPRYQQVANVTL